MMSRNLRNMLVNDGWWPLAHAVKTAQETAPPEGSDVESVVRSLSYKIAAHRINRRLVLDGVAAFEALRRDP